MNDRNLQRARRHVIAVLQDIAAGGWEAHDGTPVPAEVGSDAIRIVCEAWGIKTATALKAPKVSK